MRALCYFALALFTALSVPSLARAAPSSPAQRPAQHKERAALLLPTLIQEGAILRAPSVADAELHSIVTQLEALLHDTAQDLGLTLEQAPRDLEPSRLDDSELLKIARARKVILLLPSLRRADSGEAVLRIVLAAPNARAIRVRSERVDYGDIQLRAVIMLRDLLADLSGSATTPSPLARDRSPGILTHPVRSEGRAVLLVNTSLFGGLAGYSIQRSSGSSDPRLLYPLLAVGAGIGLGGSILAAEEWDVGTGDAWYLSAGEWWPTLAGHFIYQGRFSPRVETDRWVFGLVGGTTGLTLSILGLTLHHMPEGGALLAHSGGALGLVIGGLSEAIVRGNIQTTPFAGMGYGAGLGWLAAAAIATQLRISPARVLYLDLGALLGGLGGAAIASPLLLDAPDDDEQRVFAAAALSGALIGGTIAVIATRERPASPPPTRRAFFRAGLPTIGVIGESALGAARAPIFGLAWQGTLSP